jgi:hypothetical protein
VRLVHRKPTKKCSKKSQEIYSEKLVLTHAKLYYEEAFFFIECFSKRTLLIKFLFLI